MAYRIKEVETIVVHDLVLFDLPDVIDVIKTFVKVDRMCDPPRDVTYVIVECDSDGHIVDDSDGHIWVTPFNSQKG